MPHQVKDLARRLNLTSVIAISISSMLGSGIFVLPGVAIALSGPSVWLSYLIGSICAFPAAMSKAELATAMPTSGGTYVYIERTFGPLAGTISGIGLWLSLLLKSAFALIGIGAYLSVLTNFPLLGISLGILLIIVAMNVAGIGKVGGALMAVVVISVGGLMLLAAAGGFSFNPQLIQPMFPHGSEGTFAAAAAIFVSYAGVTKVAAVAEEVQNPGRVLPLGILISLLIVTIVYCVVTFVLVGNIPSDQIIGDLKPIYTLGRVIGGPTIGIVAAIIAILTMSSMANAGVLAASRFPFAMSRDQLVPSTFGRLSKRFLTPVNSILASGVIVALSISFLRVDKIAKYASACILMIFIIENVAVMILRESRVQWYKPDFRSPMYPWLQIAGITSGCFLLVSMGSIFWGALIAVSCIGMVIYFGYGHRRTDRKGVVGFRKRRHNLVEGNTEPARRSEPAEELPNTAEVIVALFGKEKSAETMIEMALALSGTDRFVEVVHLTEVPEQTDLHSMDNTVNPMARSLQRRIQAMEQEKEAEVHFDQLVAHDIYMVIYDISQRLHCQWLVKEWGGRSRGTFTFHRQMGWLEDHLQCNVMTYRDNGVRYIKKIMLLIPPGKADRFLIEHGDHLAEIYGAEITLASFVGSHTGADEAALKNLETIQPEFQSPTSTKIITGKDLVDSIVSESTEYDLLIMRDQRKKSFITNYKGTSQDFIIARSACSVICLKEMGQFATHRPTQTI